MWTGPDYDTVCTLDFHGDCEIKETYTQVQNTKREFAMPVTLES